MASRSRRGHHRFRLRPSRDNLDKSVPARSQTTAIDTNGRTICSFITDDLFYNDGGTSAATVPFDHPNGMPKLVITSFQIVP